MINTKKDFDFVISRLRRNNFTLTELEKITGISRRTIKRLCNGESDVMNYQQAIDAVLLPLCDSWTIFILKIRNILRR